LPFNIQPETPLQVVRDTCREEAATGFAASLKVAIIEYTLQVRVLSIPLL
jgi:hypothetical protein